MVGAAFGETEFGSDAPAMVHQVKDAVLAGALTLLSILGNEPAFYASQTG